MRLQVVSTYLQEHDDFTVGACRAAFELLAAKTRSRWRAVGRATLLDRRLRNVLFYSLPLNLARLEGYEAVMSFLNNDIPSLSPKLVFFEFEGCLYLVDIAYGNVFEKSVRRCVKTLEAESGRRATDISALK